MPEQGSNPHQPKLPPSNLEREESQLWRWALGLFILMATAVAVLSWEQLKNLPYKLWAIPVGLLVLSILFAVYAFGRRREVGDLKHLLKNLQDRAGVMPSDQQLDQLTQMIARSQRNFKELIDSLEDVALAISLDGTFRTVNRRVTEILGVPYTEIVGHKLTEFLSGDLRAESEASLSRFLEKRRWSGLVRVQVKNNSRSLYFDCVLNAIIKSDEVVGMSALARDVTEEREKERRFTELFETLHEGVYFSTPEGKLLDGNPALIRMLGCSGRDELLSLDPSALNLDPGQGPVLGRSADDRGSERSRELTLRRKDGTTGVFLDTSRAVWDGTGNIIRYQGTLVDVTERRKMEKALRQQEEFQRYLLESFPDLILVVGLDGRYSFVSSRSRDLLGRIPAEIRGKKVDDAEQEQSAEFAALYHDVSTGAKKFGFCEFGARHRDGSWRTMRANASPLFDADGKASGVIMSVRDITLERKLEQQIIQSERLAAMGQMIGGFAHELNNPLTSIMGIAELLQEGEQAENRRKQLVMLQQQARRAADIVQNLMYFSRPPAPGKSPINLSELVQRTLHLHAYSLRKNNITVDFLPEPSLPVVNGDSHQLMQIFLNLMLNAEQAMREARDLGTLRIRLEKTDKAVAVTFQDDGPGIAAEVLPNIFDPFYTTKRPGRGTGLGLSICKAILREHGGEIEASSGPGGGAVFRVTLPTPDSASA